MSALSFIGAVLPFANKLVDGWDRYQERKSEEVQAEHEATIEAMRNGVTLRGRKWVLHVSFWMVAYPYLSMWIPWFGVAEHTFMVMDKVQELPPIALWSWLLVLGAIWGVGIKDVPAKLWKK
jgi:hypothetical protein